jgi:hypothetical protein
VLKLILKNYFDINIIMNKLNSFNKMSENF